MMKSKKGDLYREPDDQSAEHKDNMIIQFNGEIDNPSLAEADVQPEVFQKSKKKKKKRQKQPVQANERQKIVFGNLMNELQEPSLVES